MLKKLMYSLFAIALSFSLVACGGKKVSKEDYDAKVAELATKQQELDAKNAALAQVQAELDALKAPVVRAYKADGVYTAFKPVIDSHGAPNYITVSVTVKGDKIVSYFIDTLQSTAVKNDDGDVTGYNFNAKTKKQLGYAYRMHGQRNLSEEDYIEYLSEEDYIEYLKDEGKLEWFEQAQLVETYMLEHSPEAVEFKNTEEDKLNVPTNVTGVTVTANEYVEVAKEAVLLAKAGKFQAVVADGADIVFATAEVDANGALTNYKLDTLQGTVTAEGYEYNAKTKQELGYAYRMHKNFHLSEEDYIEYLKDEGKLEWFEQAALLCEDFAKYGAYNMTVVDSEGYFQAVTGVTIADNKYIEVLSQLVANAR